MIIKSLLIMWMVLNKRPANNFSGAFIVLKDDLNDL